MIGDCPVHQGCPFVFTNNGVKAQGDVVRLKQKLDALLKADGGPPFVKLGAKRVRYRLTDIVAFEQSFTTLAEARAGSPEAEATAAKQRETFKRLRPMAMRKRLSAAAKRRAAKRA